MCLGLANGYKPSKYSVDEVVCDYGVFENGKLINGLILNSRANALLIADVLNADARHEVHCKAAGAAPKTKFEVGDKSQ